MTIGGRRAEGRRALRGTGGAGVAAGAPPMCPKAGPPPAPATRGLLAAGDRNVRQGRYEEALRFYRAAARGRRARGSSAARLQYNMGYALARLGRHFAAARAYRQSLELVPDDAAAWFNLGNAYHAAGAHRRAVAAYREATGLAPDDHECWNNLANAAAAAGDLDASCRACRRALAIRPDYHPAWNNLGNALQSGGDPRGAVDCYDRAIRLQGGTETLYYFNRALALLSAGRSHEALRDIRRWAAAWPYQDIGPRPLRPLDWIGFLRSLAPRHAAGREVR